MLKLAAKNHFKWTELWSMAHTFLAFLALDVAVQGSFEVFLTGEFSQEAAKGLLLAVGRSAIKFILNLFSAKLKKPVPADVV